MEEEMLIGTRAKKRMKGEMRNRRTVSQICLLLLTVLRIGTPSSAQSTVTTTTTTVTTTSSTTTTTTTTTPNTAAVGYRTQPANISVAVGEPAVFLCGVPTSQPNLTFTLYRSYRNYSLTCPLGHVEDIPQALDGSCEMKDGESLAAWTLQATSLPDSGTRVVCQQLGNPQALSAILNVYDNGASNAVLIGCIVGGFFGVLLVAALLYVFLVKSESFQECFGGGETEDDITNIVSKD